MKNMKKILALSTLCVLTISSAPSFGQERKWQSNRFQLEGNLATTFNEDVGFNIGANYAPHFPGVWDGAIAVGGFWQWTFDAEDLERDADVMKLGGELRLQRAWGALVPYIKGEAGWVRFDNGKAINKFGAGPGAGLNFWLTHNFGLGAEANTTFIFDRGDAPDDQITSFLVGVRFGFQNPS